MNFNYLQCNKSIINIPESTIDSSNTNSSDLINDSIAYLNLDKYD